jgi:hypothetical protein
MSWNWIELDHVKVQLRFFFVMVVMNHGVT